MHSESHLTSLQLKSDEARPPDLWIIVPVDIVVDTNVLAHADNPSSGRQDESKQLLDLIDAESIPICIDVKQQIVNEYLEKLAHSSLGMNMLKKWILNKNYVALESSVNPSDSGWIGRNIEDSLDRVFLKVTLNSTEKDFVTHDFEDFHVRQRKKIMKRLPVTLETAEEYLP